MTERDPRPAHRSLVALARGVLGEAYDPEVPSRILETVSQLPRESDRKQFWATLRLLDTRGGALALTGRARPISWRSQDETEQLLRGWKSSRVPQLRQLAGALLAASVSAVYGHPGPQWEHIGYPGPYGSPPDEPRRLHPIAIDSDEWITGDVVVVGSGPGGGCVAAHLASQGLDVIVLEKGGYHAERDFHHLESWSQRDLYLYGATLTTADAGVRIIAGSTLGGGAVVNYTVSFRTPPRVLEQWSAMSGIAAFANGEMEASLDEVSSRLNVNRDSSAANGRDRLMEEGLKKLGWHVDQMPRNVKGCAQDEQCGYCGFGCRVGAKMGARVYLEEAAGSGARIVTGANVEKVTIEDGRATGVVARCGDKTLTVSARAVVVAAGAIETPALLLRSGLEGRVGRGLRLHPGTPVWGVFDEDVRMWEGVQMARYSDEHRGWDDGYGPIWESVPLHPAAWATVVPWTSARDHFDLMSLYPHVSYVAPLSRDRTAGRVTIDKHGAPRIDYKLQVEDEARIIRAVIEGSKILEAAGARRIYSGHGIPTTYRVGEPGGRERWADEVGSRGYRNGRAILGSFHQMGSCPIGVDPSTSAVGPDGETHEVRDLFVTDGSTFPDASGVNPMLSIFGIANMLAPKIAARF